MPLSLVHPRARASNSANLTIANNTNTVVTYDTEVFDTGGLYAAGTPNRFTITQAGLYLITGSIEWSNSTTTGKRTFGIYVNGTLQIAAVDDGITTHTNAVEQNISALYLLAAADYVQLKAYQTSGGNLDIVQQDYSPIFSIVLIGT